MLALRMHRKPVLGDTCLRAADYLLVLIRDEILELLLARREFLLKRFIGRRLWRVLEERGDFRIGAAREDSVEGVIIVLRNWIVLVVVTASARHGQAHQPAG